MLRGRAVSLCALAFLLSGCPGPSSTDAGAPDDAGSTACPARADNDEQCQPIFAPRCGPGTMPVLGRTDCVPVGVSSCDGGLSRDDGGFGCAASLPADCGPFERMTASGCVAVGDCAAPFPPAGATLVVDDDGPLDATHVRTLADALQALDGGAGVIAVEAGTYPERLELRAPVTVVGRCPAQVTLTEPPDGGFAGSPGISVLAPVAASVSGLTLAGFQRGIVSGASSTVAVKDVVVASPRGLGFHARVGSTLTLTDVAIHDVTPTPQGTYGWAGAVYGGAHVVATRVSAWRTTSYGVLVSDTGSRFEGTEGVLASVRFQAGVTSPDAALVVAQKGASASVDGFVLDDSDRHGARASSQSTLAVKRSVLTRTLGDSGAGVASLTGSTVTVEDTTLAGHPRHGAFADGAGSTLSLTRVLVTRAGDEGAGAVFSLDGASVSVAHAALIDVSSAGVAVIRARAQVRDTYIHGVVPRPASASVSAKRFGTAVDVLEGSTVTVERVTAVAASTMGLAVLHTGVLTGSDVLVRDVRSPRPVETWSYGVGLWASFGGRLSLTRAAVTDVAGVGVMASGLGTEVTLGALSVHRVTADVTDTYGHLVVASGGGALELVEPRLVLGSAVGLVAVAGTVRVTGGVVAQNPVALHAEGGSSIVQSDETSPLAQFEVRVSSSTRFAENATKVGLAAVPVPPDVAR